MGFFNKIKEGLLKTRDSITDSFNSVVNRFTKIDEDFFEELEEALVMSDMGVQTAVDLCDILRKKSQGDRRDRPCCPEAYAAGCDCRYARRGRAAAP